MHIQEKKQKQLNIIRKLIFLGIRKYLFFCLNDTKDP